MHNVIHTYDISSIHMIYIMNSESLFKGKGNLNIFYLNAESLLNIAYKRLLIISL